MMNSHLPNSSNILPRPVSASLAYRSFEQEANLSPLMKSWLNDRCELLKSKNLDFGAIVNLSAVCLAQWLA
jgi:hypothetical protein